jgi:hypothetical protein
VHQDEAVRIQLWEKFANLLLAQRCVTIAEEKIDATFDSQVQAGFIARVDPLAETGRSKALLRGGENFRVILACDDPAEAIGFESFRDAQCA